ncbi:MAG: chemotaxis protein CheW [Candidatus Riflebacteria bacterium]|nr:chemotaxis protein CheW [Candidatus Riflebacteria bacterium]
MDNETEILLKEFTAESLEQLADIESDLLQIEEAGSNYNENLINKVFRAAHSIKGASGMFEFHKMQELSHKAETLLDLMRSKVLAPNPENINILLKAFDKLREMIQNSLVSNDMVISGLTESLTKLVESSLPKKPVKSSIKAVELALPNNSKISIPQSEMDFIKANKLFVYFAEYDLIRDIDNTGKKLLDAVKILGGFGKVLFSILDFDSVGFLEDNFGSVVPFRLVLATEVPPEQIESVLDIPDERIFTVFPPQPPSSISQTTSPSETHPEGSPSLETPNTVTPQGDSSKNEATLRVKVDLLENLMNLAGELVLSRNQLREAFAKNNSRGIAAGTQRINLVTTELQEAIMQTRMQPIGVVFSKFTRLVRDLSRDLKKEIQLKIEGKDVEMDKTLIEGLSDPLTHMIRNSCDHGIEIPEERNRLGKKLVGIISLNAYHEAGQVVIEVGDDGKGIDPKAVASSSVSKGLIPQEKIQGMSDKEKMGLIFLPGVSTSEKVSNLSGRGVGMDVVKTNLDKLGGKIEIESEVGKGALFRIKLPLTLAIIPSLIVSLGEERFAIPQINVVELICVSVAQVKKRIELVGNVEVLNIRGNLIPLVTLRDILGIPRTFIDPETKEEKIEKRLIVERRSKKTSLTGKQPFKEEKTNKNVEKRISQDRRYHFNDLNVVIISTGLFQYGLIVDQLFNTEEIVVKPLGRHLKSLQEYAGATIMGDGKVALILDASGLAAQANLTSVSDTPRAAQVREENLQDRKHDLQSFLTFKNSHEEDCVVPLDIVLRVEKIKRSQLENLGGKRTMQYRSQSLPIVTLSDVAKVKKIEEDQELAVVVSEVGNREVGLLVAMPIDVLETKVTIDQNTLKQVGIVGSTIIKDRTIMMIDVHELVRNVFPDWFVEEAETMQEKANLKPLVLLAEDSDFFRGQIKKFLQSVNCDVIEAADGQIAWETLQEKGEKIKLLVTDIEMPRMNGLVLCQNIRKSAKLCTLPIIGVTSLSGEENVERGLAAGINEYQIKLDRERLVKAIRKYLKVS